ncbi:response regulator [Xanthobacter autotrophicus DSM 431]|uniref:response regulator n=1 Tax=Xanthobacter nonsaccharivorans TaxID=3119912 RepID=UPI00372BA4CC
MEQSSRGLAGPFLEIISRQRPLGWRLGFAAIVVAVAILLRTTVALSQPDLAPFMVHIGAIFTATLVCGGRIGLGVAAVLIAGEAGLAVLSHGEKANPLAAGPARSTLVSFGVSGFVALVMGITLGAGLRRLEAARGRLAAAVAQQDVTVATLEALLDHAPVGFAFFDRQLRFVRVNEMLARMDGIPVSSHPGRSLTDLLPQLSEALTPGIARVVQTGGVIAGVEVEGATPAAPAVWRHFLASYFPVRTQGPGGDGPGAVPDIGLVGMIVVEITERKKAERDIAESERRYRLLAEALPKMVWTSTPDGTGDYYNRHWTEFTGDRAGREWHAFLHPDDLRPATEAWQASLSSGNPFTRECRLRAADGSYRWFLCRALPVRDETGRIDRWYGSCTDISEIVAAREALARTNEDLERLAAARTTELARANERLKQEMADRLKAEAQLRQAQKMEAVGQLTGGIAHDFNNLLTVIIGNLEAAERRVAPEATEIRRFLDYGRQGALRAATLTQRLLAFSRRQPLDPRPTDVNRLVLAMSQMLRSALGERMNVETRLADALWRTEIDHNQLENAILNLAVNARDAMPAGGTLTIETANAYLDEAYCAEHEDIAPGHYVAVSVSDTGIGMTQDVRARAFEPFFTTKGPRDGTGLGLSQVYGFVKQSGGHVMIYSARGEGTTVKLYLRRLVETGLAENTPPRPARKGAGATASVMVVEDDPQLRALSVSILREAGHDVIEAKDAAGALGRLDDGARPDLLFTDVRLGEGMDGTALAEEVRRRLANIRVLFTTAYAKNARALAGRSGPQDRLLAKPFSQAELVGKVKDILDEPAKRGVVLLVEDEPFVALVARQILEDHGFEVIVASHGQAALEHARGPAAPGIVLAVVDVGLPDMRGDDVVRALAGIRPDLPVIIATGYGTSELEGEFGASARIALMGKPYDGATLREGLRRLGFEVSEE